MCQSGSLANKFAAFGWEVHEVDGHDMDALIKLLGELKASDTPTPKMVIAHTVKGKGVSFMENQVGWHGKAPNDEQAQEALAQLKEEHEKIKAELDAYKNGVK